MSKTVQTSEDDYTDVGDALDLTMNARGLQAEGGHGRT